MQMCRCADAFPNDIKYFSFAYRTSVHLKNLHICIYAHLHINNMSLSDFFTPIDLDKITPKNGYYTSHLGSKIDHYSTRFPDLDQKTDIAIIGVQEDRNSVNNSGCALGP